MTEADLDKIIQMPSSAIIAPAGHGKTEMIADIVKHAEGKQLLLTHTNAGVDAIEKRLQKRKISKEKYTVTTIAAFCIKWCVSYDNTGNFDKTLSPLMGSKEAKAYYEQLYRGAKKIFATSWAGSVLKASYAGIIVDEYQDCIQVQHEIVLAMNKHLPVIVLGDPMQGIFSFAGDLVDWNALEFPIVDVETKPWRWNKSNPELGEYLMTVRNALLPILSKKNCSIQIDTKNKNVEVIDPANFTGYSHLKELSQFSSVVYITKWPQQQLKFCLQTPGIFQYDEKQDCDELFKYSTLPIDDFLEDDLLGSIPDVVHPLHPCHLILCFQLLGNTMLCRHLLYKAVEHFSCPVIHLRKVTVQLTAEYQTGVQYRSMLSDVAQMSSAPHSDGRGIGFFQHETRDVIVTLKLVPKAIILIVDVFLHDICPPYVNLILR